MSSAARNLLGLRALYREGTLSEQEYIRARRRLLGVRVRRDPDSDLPSDLPWLFALGTLAMLATLAAVYFLIT